MHEIKRRGLLPSDSLNSPTMRSSSKLKHVARAWRFCDPSQRRAVARSAPAVFLSATVLALTFSVGVLYGSSKAGLTPERFSLLESATSDSENEIQIPPPGDHIAASSSDSGFGPKNGTRQLASEGKPVRRFGNTRPHTDAQDLPGGADMEDMKKAIGAGESKTRISTLEKGEGGVPESIKTRESDLYLRRLWGDPMQDLDTHPRGLILIAAGVKQMDTVDKMIQKFPPEDFTLVLCHYDGGVDAWDRFKWSRAAIHVAAPKQTKWWFAKRFLHPSIVSAYDYVFVWDEDLDLTHFHGLRYMAVMDRFKLEISQPGLDVQSKGVTWPITRRKGGSEVHFQSTESFDWAHCDSDSVEIPCAGFVEIMAPVFSRSAWKCFWDMIQNDLVHGWGLDFKMGACTSAAPHLKIGVVDSEWITHLGIPSLGRQGNSTGGGEAWKGVRDRCHLEWKMFQKRWANE